MASLTLRCLVINHSPTRLNTEDVNLWRTFGLPISQNGLLQADGYRIDSQSTRDCMFANALIWITSKMCNFIAAPPPTAVRLETWSRLQLEIDHWSDLLPPSFSPSARVKPAGSTFDELERLTRLNGTRRQCEEIWFPKTLCAATMQHYHMAKIILLLNKPQETTTDGSLGRRFHSMRNDTEEVVLHCYQIM